MKELSKPKPQSPSEEIWAILRETAAMQKETARRQEENDRAIKELFEAQKETAHRQEETDRWKEESNRRQEENDRAIKELTEAQKETARAIKELTEAQKETAGRQEETDRWQEKTDRRQEEAWLILKEADRIVKETAAQMKETDRKLGKFGNRLGEIIEHMVMPNLEEKFCKFGFLFNKAYPHALLKDEKQQFLTEVDITLESEDNVMLVEVKSKPTIDDIKEHLERMKKVRLRAYERADTRKYLGAVAGMVFNENERAFTLKSGFYAIEPSGETFTIIPPDGPPREW